MMEEQKAITDKGATMRLGSYDCALRPEPWRQGPTGRPDPRAPPAPLRGEQRLRGAPEGSADVSGINPQRNLVEIIELKDHPWFVAVQFHPEFQSKPNRAHPLFAAFIAAAIRTRRRARPKAKKGGRVKIFDPARLLLIAGPCSLESESVCRAVAAASSPRSARSTRS
jgi:CTP synthase